MDYEDIRGPMYCDFESLQQGVDVDEEGDEWFDGRVEEAEEECYRDSDPVSTLDRDKSPVTAEVTADTQSQVKMNEKKEMAAKLSKVFANKSKQTQPKILPSRNAALKATISISEMYKPKSSSSATSTASNHGSTTRPTTPKFIKRQQSRQTPKSMKSTEELELEKIELLKWEANKRKELSKQSFKRMKKHGTPKAVRPVKAPTEAVGFNFKMDSRIKKVSRNDGEIGCSSSSSVFPMNLRSSSFKNDYNPNDPGDRKPATPRDVTHVKPFRFMTEERIQQRKRHRSGDQKYVSTAEYVEKFQKTTPPRFRTKVPYDIAEKSSKNGKIDITLPKTPNLQSRKRSRPVTAISRAEKEEQELEELKKYQFKAKPVNPEIFRLKGELGVPKPVTQPMTNPVSPCLATKERFSAKRDRDEMETEEERRDFKAMPMPRVIFDKITGVPSKRSQKPTTALSPALSFKRRKVNEETANDEPSSPPPTTIKPLPMPDFSNAFKPVVEHAHTETQPFSFDQKYPSKDNVVSALVTKEETEAAKKREFRANPLPDLENPPLLPEKVKVPNTEGKPFRLDIEKRVQERLQKFHEKVRLEKEEEDKKHEFRASENKACLYSKPFEPVKGLKPLTESGNIVLHTALRSEDRSKYDEERRKREMERELDEQNARALRDAEEEEQIRALRQTLVHKPLPLHDYPPVNIKKSTKLPTKPQSPILLSKTRSRADNDNIRS